MEQFVYFTTWTTIWTQLLVEEKKKLRFLALPKSKQTPHGGCWARPRKVGRRLGGAKINSEPSPSL